MFRAPVYVYSQRLLVQFQPLSLSFPRSPQTGFQHSSSNHVLECVVLNQAAQGGRDSGIRGMLDIYSHYFINSVAQWFRAPVYIVRGCWFNSSPCHYLSQGHLRPVSNKHEPGNPTVLHWCMLLWWCNQKQCFPGEWSLRVSPAWKLRLAREAEVKLALGARG